MSHRTDIVYEYDGSFYGLLCCVFESFAKKEIPAFIRPAGAPQDSLFPVREIVTDEGRAKRVLCAIPQKISGDGLHTVKHAFLTCDPEKELHILQYLRLGFRHGSRVAGMVKEDCVYAINQAVGHLLREKEKYLGFVRFSETGFGLYAVIEPKNFILPAISPHFCGRMSGETFLIYDKTHRAAFFHEKGKGELLYDFEPEIPPIGAEEAAYRKLWRQFYKTIAIKNRENPRCQMNFMPKRYWAQLTEMQDSDENEENLQNLALQQGQIGI